MAMTPSTPAQATTSRMTDLPCLEHPTKPIITRADNAAAAQQHSDSQPESPLNGIFASLMNDPQPIRRLIRYAIRKAKLGSPKFRYDIGATDRPHYAYLVYQAAWLAHRLGHKSVSILEFGVAGGTGLLALERHAEWVEKLIPVTIEIYGFDTGEGLPELSDYRDLGYHWRPGFFKMDQEALKRKLKRSTLVLGNIRDTIDSFVSRYSPAPIGAMSHDFDFYSSTMDGFKIFDVEECSLLPRVVCYFDDVVGTGIELYNDYIGERAAIHDFNKSHDDKKLSPAYYLVARGGLTWHHQIWSFHNFKHPQYSTFISDDNQQLPL